MTLLNKVVEMEYIITINVNITYIDANQNSVNNALSTAPIRVNRNDQGTIKMLLDHVVGKCMPPGLKKTNYHPLIYYDEPPGFSRVRHVDRKLSMQQFIQKFMPSSLHPGRTHFTFVVIIAARPVAAAV